MPDGRASITYLDFEIEISALQGGAYALKVLHSPAGEASAEFSLPFNALELERYLDKLQIALLRSAGLRKLTPEEQVVQDFGRRLFDTLLSGEVRSRYDVSQAQARAQRKGLRLKLRVQPPELAALPWEYLYDSRQNAYVCLSTNTPVVRYLEMPQPMQPLSVELPLRILGMIASPQAAGCSPLDVTSEKKRLERALHPLREKRLAELVWLEQGNWRALQRTLRQGPWHIFHFIGHGRYNRAAEQGELAFEDERGGLDPMSAERLATLLSDHNSLRLVLLNACESAQGGAGDPLSSIAATLIRRGLPAVLAMQYSITDQAAIEITQAFYEALAEGLPVDAAAAEARKALRVAKELSLEWGIPALYMHTSDGVLFHLDKASAAATPIAPQVSEPHKAAPRAAPGGKPETGETAQPEQTPLPPASRQEQIEREYTAGQSAFWRQDWAQARRHFQVVLAAQPDHQEAAAKLEEIARQERLAAAYARAVSSIQTQDWSAASQALQAVTSEDARYLDAARRLEFVEQRLQLAELYARAKRLHSAGNWKASLAVFEQIDALQADYPDPEGLRLSARKALARQQEETLLNNLHHQALGALEKSRWAQAEKLLITLLEKAPDFPGAAGLLERARSEQARMAQARQSAAQTTPPFRLSRKVVITIIAGALMVTFLGVCWGLYLKVPSLLAFLFSPTPTIASPVVTSISSSTPTQTPLHTSPTFTLTPTHTSLPTATSTQTPTPTETPVFPGMALIPAGEFLMGSETGASNEKPLHAVYLDGFYMDIYEVTNAQYKDCVQAGSCTPPEPTKSNTRSSYYGEAAFDDYPVIYVDWSQARAYCQWRGGDLPCEAQWEKAARGGLEGKQYPWGDEDPVCQKGARNGAKFDDNAGCNDTDTEPVGSYSPNGYGLYDMAGNVWEWVLDWYQSNYYNNQPTWINPLGPSSGDGRVLRGGSWIDVDISALRAANRGGSFPINRFEVIGFRCSRSLAPISAHEASPTPTEMPVSALPTVTNPPDFSNMALIPAGEFLMGSETGDSDEKPLHAVYLDAYYIDVYEVTNAQYEDCVQAGSCTPPEPTKSNTRSSYYGEAAFDDYPVIYVDWSQARAYCQWRGGDLPCEAQWEKAARGGLEGKQYPWGDEDPVCTPGAENGAQFYACSPYDTVQVGSFGANRYGLYDMAGNVWEWVLDWYQSSYYNSQSTWSNPFGPSSGDGRVLRGGSWSIGDVSVLRAANRFRSAPSNRYDYLGFRCSRSP